MAMLDPQRRLLVLADGAEARLSASEFELLRLFVEIQVARSRVTAAGNRSSSGPPCAH